MAGPSLRVVSAVTVLVVVLALVVGLTGTPAPGRRPLSECEAIHRMLQDLTTERLVVDRCP